MRARGQRGPVGRVRRPEEASAGLGSAPQRSRSAKMSKGAQGLGSVLEAKRPRQQGDLATYGKDGGVNTSARVIP